MKIIDLLNKIANGEIDKNNKYQFSEDDYCTINDFFARYIVDEENLNLEILEKEKKIPEKLKYYDINDFKNDLGGLREYTTISFVDVFDKINEICDYLKSKGE